jgi:hypothetical protein
LSNFKIADITWGNNYFSENNVVKKEYLMFGVGQSLPISKGNHVVRARIANVLNDIFPQIKR